MRISVDPLHPVTSGSTTRETTPKPARDSSVQTVAKTLAILEAVAERGSATAKEIAEVLGFPLPTAYRLLHALVHAEYLVHRREERRFELSHKLEALARSARSNGATVQADG
ncbi:helix-turn-helix domain-containing protein [Curtobacterium sp. NPDC090217]|uniref:helix-turn-helix domain-containing protein n=1 Tax=Curtobacterium sp. NPDC090217 TaxID=3363970 RepID=UPI0037F36B85